nr:CHASE2 domain-containing protein [Actinomycetota bacterium]
MPFRRGLRVVVIASLVAAVGAVASLTPRGFRLEEENGLSWLFQLRGPRPAPAEAVVVRFDRDAFARLRELPPEPESWPQPLAGCARRSGPLGPMDGVTAMDRLPRGVQACLVEELTRRGAAVLAFDIALRRDPAREAGVTALAAAMRAHGSVILLDWAVREPPQASWSPAGPVGMARADLLERPHTVLAREALATASFVLPRSSTLTHQFWVFNPALPADIQLPTRALEALALPLLARLTAGVGEPLPNDLRPAELFRRHVDRFRAEVE